jgi:hypothetical protein
MSQANVEAFYRLHCASVGGVVLAIAIHQASCTSRYGVFTSLEKAMDWSASLGDDYACVFAPKIADEPDFGEIPGN